MIFCSSRIKHCLLYPLALFSTLSGSDLSIMEREGEKSQVAVILLPIFVHNSKGNGSI
ncbi:hypothetical protein AMTRI_Chr02g218980 [Amborella trichopoda]